MPPTFAQGTWTRIRVPAPSDAPALEPRPARVTGGPASTTTGDATPKAAPPRAAAPAAPPSEAELSTMSVAAKVERLLFPQHRALRIAMTVLRAAATQLARLDATCAPALTRVLAVTDELATAMNAAFELEVRPESALADAGPRASAIDDHHERFATSLRKLRGLAAEVRAAAGLTHDTMVIFAAIATVTRLFARHREARRWVLLSPLPSPRPPARATGGRRAA